MSVYDDARALAPEIGGLSDATLAPFLPLAQAMVGVSWYGADYSTALALALAHRAIRGLANSGGTSGGGTIGGGTVGPLTAASNRAASVSYGGPLGASSGYLSAADADLMLTAPGQALRVLRDSKAGNSPQVIL